MIENLVWTDELVEILKAKWADGASATVIASEMMVTRSAVLGKVFRLKLTKRRVPQPKTPERPYKRRKSPWRPQDRPVVHLTRGMNNLPPDQSSYAVSLLDVRRDQCRFPLNDPGPEFMFCGAPTDATYCDRHSRICYINGRKPTRAEFELNAKLNQRKHVQSLIEQVMGVES